MSKIDFELSDGVGKVLIDGTDVARFVKANGFHLNTQGGSGGTVADLQLDMIGRSVNVVIDDASVSWDKSTSAALALLAEAGLEGEDAMTALVRLRTILAANCDNVEWWGHDAVRAANILFRGER